MRDFMSAPQAVGDLAVMDDHDNRVAFGPLPSGLDGFAGLENLVVRGRTRGLLEGAAGIEHTGLGPPTTDAILDVVGYYGPVT